MNYPQVYCSPSHWILVVVPKYIHTHAPIALYGDFSSASYVMFHLFHYVYEYYTYTVQLECKPNNILSSVSDTFRRYIQRSNSMNRYVVTLQMEIILKRIAYVCCVRLYCRPCESTGLRLDDERIKVALATLKIRKNCRFLLFFSPPHCHCIWGDALSDWSCTARVHWTGHMNGIRARRTRGE